MVWARCGHAAGPGVLRGLVTQASLLLPLPPFPCTFPPFHPDPFTPPAPFTPPVGGTSRYINYLTDALLSPIIVGSNVDATDFGGLVQHPLRLLARFDPIQGLQAESRVSPILHSFFYCLLFLFWGFWRLLGANTVPEHSLAWGLKGGRRLAATRLHASRACVLCLACSVLANHGDLEGCPVHGAATASGR
jgi:hypothetical protein